MAMLAEQNLGKARALDCAHPPLAEQLDQGVRSLELDVYYDPEGGRHAQPHGLQMIRQRSGAPRPFDPKGLMQAPGFKVLHIQELDFRSHCLTLQRCLQAVRQWSEAHPNHVPLIITVEARQGTTQRRDAPFARGAHVVTTDHYRLDPTPGHRLRGGSA
jgi:hypothetical protein